MGDSSSSSSSGSSTHKQQMNRSASLAKKFVFGQLSKDTASRDAWAATDDAKSRGPADEVCSFTHFLPVVFCNSLHFLSPQFVLIRCLDGC
jgi:hypothetical protein